MTDPLKRPLVFGDKEQIAALRQAEAAAEYAALPKCDECEGRPVCSACHRECEQCDGTGRSAAELAAWREKFPCARCS